MKTVYYTQDDDDYDIPQSSLEFARAIRYMRSAIQPWEGQQSHVDTHALRNWANTKAAQTTTASKSSGSPLYSPISGPFEIRVLEIQPGGGDSRIECNLHHCSLEFDGRFKREDNEQAKQETLHATSLEEPAEPLWYTALSYTWGPPVFDKVISVNSQNLNITTSLFKALVHFRHPSHSIILWIDQICIDQLDTTEKEQQIPLMSRIYRHALNTVSWLGEPRRHPAVNPFDALQHCAINLWLCTDLACPGDFARLGLPAAEADEWADVWDVLSAPYFTRVWILQELLIPDNIVMACGRHRASWRLITDATLRLEDSGIARWLVARFSGCGDQRAGRAATPFDYLSYLNACYQDRVRSGWLPGMRRSNRGHMVSYLIETRPARCWEPRDKVYGLLGLDFTVEEGWSGRIKPRYDADYPAARLFYEVAVDAVTQPTSMNGQMSGLLCAVDHEHGSSALPGLPSWVPDWTRPRLTRSILKYIANEGNIWNGLYAAGGKVAWESTIHGLSIPTLPELDFSFITERRGIYSQGLCIRGKPVDTVEKLTDTIQDPDLTWKDPKAANTALLACYAIATDVYVYLGEVIAVFDAFWRTLIANKDGEARTQAPEAYAEIFSLVLDATTGHSVDDSPSLPGQTYSVRQRRPAGRGRLELASLATRKPAETLKAIRGVFGGVLGGRRFGLTSRGYFGLFPGHARAGDTVCVFSGVEVPFVVRDAGAGALEGVSLVGECYVHGVMHGEVMENEAIAVKRFSIV